MQSGVQTFDRVDGVFIRVVCKHHGVHIVFYELVEITEQRDLCAGFLRGSFGVLQQRFIFVAYGNELGVRMVQQYADHCFSARTAEYADTQFFVCVHCFLLPLEMVFHRAGIGAVYGTSIDSCVDGNAVQRVYGYIQLCGNTFYDVRAGNGDSVFPAGQSLTGHKQAVCQRFLGKVSVFAISGNVPAKIVFFLFHVFTSVE